MLKKHLLSLSLLAMLPTGMMFADKKELPKSDVVSRACGHMIGKNLLENPGYQFNIEDVIKGMKEELAGEPSPLSEAEFEDFTAQINQKLMEEMSQTNLDEANAFLEENASREGVQELVPGKLQVAVLKEGQGECITEESTPLIHYTGRYLNDTVFGTSEQMEPIALELNDTIPGFKQGLLGAKAGEHRRLYIHPDLGYGTSGLLQPNALMVFDIEVLKTQTDESDQSS